MSSETITYAQQQPRWLSRIKALYVSLYLTALMAGTGVAAYRLYSDPSQWGWLGVAFTTLPFMILLTRAFLFQRIARTPAHISSNLIWGVVGIFISVAAAWFSGGSVLPVGLAIMLVAAYGLYDFWYSDLGREDSPVLAEGRQLPVFQAARGDGSQFTSEALLGSPAIIIFFRGNWCPFCVAQIKELVDSYQTLAAKGVKVVFVSPQNERQTAALAHRFNVSCEFLSDRNNRAADKLGIAAQGGLPLGMEALGYDSDTVLPTAIVVDSQGKILYCDQTSNYRVRPEPQAYLGVLAQHGI